MQHNDIRFLHDNVDNCNYSSSSSHYNISILFTQLYELINVFFPKEY